jgi:hypothetical protein
MKGFYRYIPLSYRQLRVNWRKHSRKYNVKMFRSMRMTGKGDWKKSN